MTKTRWCMENGGKLGMMKKGSWMFVLAVVLAAGPAVNGWGGVGPTFVQNHFQWRNDDGDASSATWKAAADVAATNVPHNQNIRLRFAISNRSGVGNFWPNFEYATSTNGPWQSVSPASGGIYPVEFSDSTWFTNKAPAGNLLSGQGTFIDDGPMVDRDGGTIDVHVSGFVSNFYVNAELCFQITSKTPGGTSYYFRLDETDRFNEYAKLTVEAYDPPEPPVLVLPSGSATVSVERVSLTGGQVEQPYVILTSGSEPMTFEAQGLPDGYGLFGNVIADNGLPSTPGTYSVTLTARNAYGADTNTLLLAVKAGQRPVPRTRVSGRVGEPFKFQLSAAGNGPIGCEIEATGGGGLPPGLSFDGALTISGTPQEPGMTRLIMNMTNEWSTSAEWPPVCVILTVTGEGPADTDNDGLPDAWERDNGLDPEDPSDGESDADADGISNADEYVAGTDPRNPESTFVIQDVNSDAQHFGLSFDTTTGRVYTVEARDELPDTNTWQTLVGDVTGTGNRLEVVDDEDRTKRFYRIKVGLTPE